MSYDAFISYSHAADGKLAPALHAGLRSFAKPYYRRRAVRVFRDDTNLGIHPDLWGEIEEALAASDFFLLLASPDGAGSKWVGKEVSFWREKRDLEKLLIVLTGGEILWDGEANDFDWDVTDAVPRALAGAFSSEPLYLDLRWARTSEDLSLANPQFRDGIARLSAELRGIPLDDLIGEDVRQHRRTKRHVRAAIVTLTALVLATSGAAWYAFGQKQFAEEQRGEALASAELARLAAASEAEQRKIAEAQTEIAVEQRELAEEQRRLAVAQRIAVQGQLLVETGGPEEVATGSLLVLESLRRNPSTLQGHLAWGSVLDRYPPLVARHTYPQAGRTNSGTAVAISPDGRHLAASTIDAGVLIIDTRDGATVHSLVPDTQPAVAVSFRAGSTLVALAEGNRVRLVDFAKRDEVARVELPSKSLALAFSPDGKTLAVGDMGGELRLFDASVAGRLRPGAVFDNAAGEVMQPVFNSQGRLVMANTWHTQLEENVVRFWDLASAQTTGSYVQGDPSALAFSPSGRLAATGGRDNVAQAFVAEIHSIDIPERSSEPISRARLRRFDVGTRPSAVAIDGEDELLAVATEGSVQLWSAQTGGRRPGLDHRDVRLAVWVDDGRTLGTASSTEVRLWNTSIGDRLGARVRGLGTPLDEAQASFERFRRQVCRRIGRDLSDQEWERYLGDEPRTASVCPESR